MDDPHEVVPFADAVMDRNQVVSSALERLLFGILAVALADRAGITIFAPQAFRNAARILRDVIARRGDFSGFVNRFPE